MTLDWSQCPAVESIPGKRSGAWVFKDTRMPVSTVFENLESGASIDEIMEWFDVTREQIVAVLEFAARSLDAPPSTRQPDAQLGLVLGPLSMGQLLSSAMLVAGFALLGFVLTARRAAPRPGHAASVPDAPHDTAV